MIDLLSKEAQKNSRDTRDRQLKNTHTHTPTIAEKKKKTTPPQFFPPGAKSPSGNEYDGGRTASDIVQWVEDKLQAFAPPPEVTQLVSSDIYSSQCTSKQVRNLSEVCQEKNGERRENIINKNTNVGRGEERILLWKV